MSDKLRLWCRDNWNRIDPLIRKDCVDHIDGWISKDIIKDWKKNGYDLSGFHHLGGGMSIRNRLRDQLTDMELPVMTKDHEGKDYGPSQNWDDYYTGAIDELLERY
jgi:hypothetical protein